MLLLLRHSSLLRSFSIYPGLVSTSRADALHYQPRFRSIRSLSGVCAQQEQATFGLDLTPVYRHTHREHRESYHEGIRASLFTGHSD